MDKFISYISRGFGFVYAFIKRMTKKKGLIKNNQILIVATGHIGNAIIDAPAIEDLSKFYKSIGKRVCLLCSDAMNSAFDLVIDLSEVTFLGNNYHYGDRGTYFSVVRQTLNNLKGHGFEKIIVTLTNCDPLAHYIVACVPTNESWGIFDDVKQEYGYIRHYFERYYTNKVMVPVDLHETQRLKLMLEQLGCHGHRTRISYIPKQMESLKRAPYITVAVDSMSTSRRWVSEKFVALIHKLLESYSYDVYLTGNHVTEHETQVYEAAFDKQLRVKNYIGKTSFKEWIELLRHSRFHIGVDSGSIHVAASVGTQSFCLTGVWDAKRVMPYQIDEKDDSTMEPICIYRSDVDINEMDCYACKVYRTRIGRGNKECYSLCMNGRPCLCLGKIEVEDVERSIASIDAVLRKQKEEDMYA